MMLRCVFRALTHGYACEVLSGRSSAARLRICRPAGSQSQDVEATETLHHRLDQSVDLSGIALVGPNARRADAMAFKCTDDCLRLVV
jgi:hypothetical protein